MQKNNKKTSNNDKYVEVENYIAVARSTFLARLQMNYVIFF